MILPDRLFVGVPFAIDGIPETDHLEVGADWGDPPPSADVKKAIGKGRTLTMIASPIITHRRTDKRYRAMADPPPEHAAVGHFERSRWTDEAWERCDAYAREIGAQAVVLQTPPTFKATNEHALRLENFIAHATRPGLALAWEWAKGSWPDKKVLELCERIGATPVVDPTEREIPEMEYVYLRVRGGASGRAVLKDDDLKKIALAVRDRIGWVIFANRTAVADAQRFAHML